MKRARWLFVSLVGLSSSVFVAVAFAAPGDLTFAGCVSGNTGLGPGGHENCANIPNSESGGEASGLDNPFAVASSPDGTHLYAASFGDDAVVVLDRDPTSGALSFNSCVSGDTAAGTGAGKNCTNLPNSAAGGAASGLNFPLAIASSPDGEQVYVASQNDDAVVAFDRDPDTGALSFNSCVSGDTAAGTVAGKNCANVPNSVAGGAASGLNSLQAVAVPPDGDQVYSASLFDDAVVVLDRHPDTGVLSFSSCISGDTAAGTNCATIPNSVAGGAASGLDRPLSLASSPDGDQIYAASQFDDAVVALDRDPDTGALSFGSCVSGNTAAGTEAGKNCANFPNSAPFGVASGLDTPLSVASSPDGDQIYAASQEDDAVVALDRDPDTGALSFNSCVSGDTAAGTGAGKNCANVPNSGGVASASGLAGIRAVAASPDSTNVYTASPSDDAVAVLERDATTGALSFKRCLSGDTGAGTGAGKNCANVPNSVAGGFGSGFDGLHSLAFSPDGNHLYGTSTVDDAVVALDRERLPLPQPPEPPPVADITAPVLSGLSLSRARFRVGTTPTPPTVAQTRRRRTPAGTRVRYQLSEEATVRFVIERRLAGRRQRVRGRRRCVKPTRRLVRRGAKRCRRFKRRGVLSRKSGAGRNSFAFSGRIGRRKLAPGRYRMRVTATDLAGNTSKPRTVAFTISRR